MPFTSRAARTWLIRGAVAALLLSLPACAARTPPPLPSPLRYADYVYPAVPPDVRAAPGAADRVDAGWRFLQNDDLRNADRAFAEALKRSPGLYPAQTGSAYVALAQRDAKRALSGFDAALMSAPRYVPALAGRGQALLALERSDEALASFEAALAVDPSLGDLSRRVDVLRFRNVQEDIGAARGAAAAGRFADARAAYERALKATPDSPFLHRELGIVERRAGNAQAALEHFRRATQLDTADAVSLVQMGELLEARQDHAGAEAAYRRALAIEPNADLSARTAVVAERAREATLPPEFRAIAGSAAITRGELAALIGVRLAPILRDAAPRQVVATDVGRHWAAQWIGEVVRAGVMDPFDNHTFQPDARLRRGDLAEAVSRLVSMLAASRPALRTAVATRPAIADMSAAHLNYPAASVAVASGVLPLLDGERFEVGRAVSGADAAAAVDRLRTLAAR